MIEYAREIDFDKYNTFFLEYVKDDNVYSMHLVRPSTVTYEELMDTSKTRTYTLEGAVLAFKHESTLVEILMECALHGISIDFIDIMVPNDEKGMWRSSTKLSQVIDLHKEDVKKYIDKVEAKRHYVALNSNKKDNLKFLVIDSFAQDNKVEFLKGKYDKTGIIAGFKSHSEAKEYCGKMNKEICKL